MDHEVRKILCELAFFLLLAAASRTWRYVKHAEVQAVVFYSSLHMFLKGVLSLAFLTFGQEQPLPQVAFRTGLLATVIGVCTGMDVAASNLSLTYISASFYTMLKSASLLFILSFALAARLEVCSAHLAAAVLMISVGMLLTSYGEAAFDASGFVLVVSSEVFAAVRWLVTQVVVHEGALDTMGLVFFMSPGSTLSLLPLALAREHEEILKLGSNGRWMEFGLLVLVPGSLAFLLVLIEVQLVKETKALALSVFGNLKSVVTILFCMVIFGERTTPLQWAGLVLALSGILLFSRYSSSKPAEPNALLMHPEVDSPPTTEETELRRA